MTLLARSGVFALVVAHAPSTDLTAVLDAVAQQTMAPSGIVLIDASTDGSIISTLPAGDSANPPDLVVVRAPAAKNLGQAIERATQSADLPPEVSNARWWWILHHDSVPEPTCLAQQWEVADRGRTIAAVGPKQFDWEGERLLEVGILATRSARRLERITVGEIDQGQYDSTSDVLAVGTAGMLVDPAAWKQVRGFDAALGPFGDGLDFGRRLHRSGFRVVVAPKARLRHRRASLARQPQQVDSSHFDEVVGLGVDSEHSDSPRKEHSPQDVSFAQRRFAQLYNWLKATPAPLLPLMMAWLVVWSPARAFGRLVTGMGHLAGAELVAWLKTILKTGHLLKARYQARRAATIPASALRGLETSPRALRAQRSLNRKIARGQRAETLDPLALASRRSYRISSALTVAGLLAVTGIYSIATWHSSSTGLTGAAWTTMPYQWSDLWRAAWATWIPGGDGAASVADPLLVILAVVSWPFHLLGVVPASLVAWILMVAPVLAVIVMWPLSRRLTSNLPLRAAAVLLWVALPALTLSQYQGRIGGVLIHLALPILAAAWMSLLRLSTPLPLQATNEVVYQLLRSRTGAYGAFALSAAIIAACAPWTLLIFVILPLVAIKRVGRRAWLLLAALLPAAGLVAPISAASIAGNHLNALITVGGGAYAGQTSQSWYTALGLPANTGWQPFTYASMAPIAILIIAILVGVVARVMKGGSLTGWRPMITAALLATSGIMTLIAVLISRTPVALVDGHIAYAWASPALSFAGLALVGAVLILVPANIPWDAPQMRRIGQLGTVMLIAAAVSLGGPIVARMHNAGADAEKTTSELAQADHVGALTHPQVSAVSSQAQQSTRAGRVLVIEANDDLSQVRAQLWRGAGKSMTDDSALTRAQALVDAISNDSYQDPAAADLASLALTLIVYPDSATVGRLADHGVDTILIPSGTQANRELADALNRAPGLERVGQTDAGDVWRLRPDSRQPARVRLMDRSGWKSVESTNLTATHTYDQPINATLVLAERADPGWRATLDGVRLESVEGSWFQAFSVQGQGRLIVEHTTWWRLPWQIGVLTLLGFAAAMSIPIRRRHHD
ncbi:glycosyltransferase [Schaalia vaccimaxillae]|uniref:glycosyltransferase n=1 Tax=Schaalia vaccimaxillae TaxID=183916 RepID=UPI0003B7A31B|nr:glycosyltransferase [Schaalia vaccimaxillae]